MTLRPILRIAPLLCAAATALSAACAAARPGGNASLPAVTATPAAEGADASCAAAFDSLQATVRGDYPGFAEKVASHEPQLTALTDSVHVIVRSSDDYRVCIPALQRWLRFFHDPHMMLWQAAPPPTGPTGAPSASVAPPAPRDDPDRPALRPLDDSTIVIRLPSLDPGYRSAVDSLVGAHRGRLLAAAALVVDMRGNGGGCTCTFDALIPLIYSGPYREAGQDLWTSPANVDFVAGWLSTEGVSDATRDEVRRMLPRLRAAPVRFVPFPGDSVVRLDGVHPLPRAVAVLVDHGCASSCEDFVLMARQSTKVTVVGSGRTAGVHDYGNVRSTWLPGWRRLRLPTSRSRTLPAGAIDNVGLAPDVLVPRAERDTVAFAVRAARRLARTAP